MFTTILTLVLGAATGGLLVRRGRSGGQILAALTGTILTVYVLLLLGDAMALYLDYSASQSWLMQHLPRVDPLLLQALALAMALLHFAIAPALLWAFFSFQHRKLATLLGAVGCGSLLAMYLVAPTQDVDPKTGEFNYKYSRDPQTNCLQRNNRELRFDTNTGRPLLEPTDDIIQEYNRQTRTHTCRIAAPVETPKPSAMPRVLVAHFARPPDDRLQVPPFAIPAHNVADLADQGTNIWSEAVAVGSAITVVKLAAKGWNESPGWLQPIVEENTYLTDQTGQRYRVLSDYGHYNDSCVAGTLRVRCHKMAPGEVYRFELGFEGLSDGAKDLRLYYTGAGAPAEIASLAVSVGEWQQHPGGVAVAVVPPAPGTPAVVEPAREVAKSSIAVPPRSSSARVPDPEPAMHVCGGTVSVHSLNLPDRFEAPGIAIVKLDWATARLYLNAGARPPLYPLVACGQRLQGPVILDLLAGPDGKVRRVEAVKGAGIFVASAEEAVRGWEFNAIRSHGGPALLATRIQFDFGFGR